MKIELIIITFLVVLSGVVLYSIFSISYEGYQNTKLCHNNFGLEYHLLDMNTDNDIYDYENVDETHYNCCWNELSFNEDEGCYNNRKCKGFLKVNKQ